MDTNKPESSSNTPVTPKKSRAVRKLEAIREKQDELSRLRATAEAEVAAEKRAATVKQGLHNFVEMLAQKGPSEIEGIITMVIANNAPAEKLESIQQWTESLKANSSGRRSSQE